MAESARLGLRMAERLGGGEARPAYVALARPDGRLARRKFQRLRRRSAAGRSSGSSVERQPVGVGRRRGSARSSRGASAARAGLRGGDVIVRMGDHGLRRFEDLRRALADRRPGDAVALIYLRDGEEHRASATLGTRP